MDRVWGKIRGDPTCSFCHQILGYKNCLSTYKGKEIYIRNCDACQVKFWFRQDSIQGCSLKHKTASENYLMSVDLAGSRTILFNYDKLIISLPFVLDVTPKNLEEKINKLKKLMVFS